MGEGRERRQKDCPGWRRQMLYWYIILVQTDSEKALWIWNETDFRMWKRIWLEFHIFMKPFEALLWILFWWLLFLSFVACWTELCVYSRGKLWTKAIWPPPPCASRSLLFWPLVSDNPQCTLEQNKAHFTYLAIKGAPFFSLNEFAKRIEPWIHWR